MKRFFLGISFILVFLSIGLAVKAFDLSFGLDSALKSLMQQGNHIVCLNADTTKISVPNDWKKKAYGTVKLFGATCNSPTGCKILRCNSSNTEIAGNDHLLNICKTRPEDWVGCNKEGKTESLEEKNANSVQVQAGCEEVTNFKLVAANNTNVLGVGTEEGSIPEGPVNVELDDSYVVHVNYEYFLSQPDDGTTITDLGAGEGITPGDDESQKLGTVDFTFTDEEVEGTIKDCEVIGWDPFGRVFDAVSLEPMSDVNITLIDDNTKKPALMKFNKNFDVTDIRGVFNILVENEGMYSLDVEPPLTHTFSNSVSLSPNYSKIYSDIYKPNAVFEEKINVPTHHDIPLQPLGEPYYDAVAELIEGSLKSYVSGNYGVYSGTTTYPFSRVCLIGAETNSVVGNCVNADKVGKYSISVHKKKIPMEFLEVQVQKVDLNNIEYAFRTVNRVKGVGYEPLFSYIEGYAYDEDGNKLLGADVAVRLLSDDKIFYTTSTDDTGKFIIYKDNLPFVEYYLEFVDPKSQKTVKKTTSSFASDNKTFLDSEKIDLVLGAKSNQPVINPVTGQLNQINEKPVEIPDEKTNVPNFLNRLYLIIIILFILIVAVISTIFYIKRSK